MTPFQHARTASANAPIVRLTMASIVGFEGCFARKEVTPSVCKHAPLRKPRLLRVALGINPGRVSDYHLRPISAAPQNLSNYPRRARGHSIAYYHFGITKSHPRGYSVGTQRGGVREWLMRAVLKTVTRHQPRIESMSASSSTPSEPSASEAFSLGQDGPPEDRKGR